MNKPTIIGITIALIIGVLIGYAVHGANKNITDTNSTDTNANTTLQNTNTVPTQSNTATISNDPLTVYWATLVPVGVIVGV